MAEINTQSSFSEKIVFKIMDYIPSDHIKDYFEKNQTFSLTEEELNKFAEIIITLMGGYVNPLPIPNPRAAVFSTAAYDVAFK